MTAFYRLLLRLYPASFRVSYGDELLRAFEDDIRDRGALRALFAALADVVPNAFLTHWELLRLDTSYTLRSLRRAPTFALTVVLVTAIGVGANVATFTVADHVLLRPLPFPDPDAIVRVCEGPRQGGGWGCMNELSPANHRDVAERVTAFSSFGTFTGTSVNVVGVGDPVRVTGAAFSPEVWRVLGIGPLFGRVTADGDRNGPAVTVLSHALWRERFGGAQDIVGRSVSLNGVPHVVVGVMPAHFIFPARETQLWTPLRVPSEDFLSRNNTYLQSVARLKPDVSFEQARTELSAIFDALAREYPATNAETGFSFFRQRDQMSPRYRLILLALGGASLALLLLTMANLGSLHLIRLAAREREIAVRAALGAGRERLVRQLMTESLLLAAAGGAVGLAVAVAVVPFLSHLVPSTLPMAAAPTIDSRVLLLAGAIATAVGLGVGLVTAMRAGRRDLFGALRCGTGGGARRQRIRHLLVGVEVAVSVVLLATSGFLVRAVWNVQRVAPGFVADGALTLRTALSDARYADPATYSRFIQDVLGEVRALPGVEAAGYTSGLPMVMTGGITSITKEGEPERLDRSGGVSWRIVTPGYFAALGTERLSGRDFEITDDTTRPLAAVVSASFAERYWPGTDPLGERFIMRGQTRTIVGVVSDVRVRGLERTSEPQMFVPSSQLPPGSGDFYLPKDLVVRSAAGGDAMSLVPSVRAIIRRLDPAQPISEVRTLREVVDQQSAERTAQARVLAALAIVALLLTAVGIHGLLAFSVEQRTREIGLRLALGAAPRRVAALVVGEAARLALLGGVPGLLLAFAAVRSMRTMLFGLEPADPAMLGGAAVIVVVVAIAGALAPAARAVRVSPMEAMRSE